MDSAIILLCGLPGAGKTTIARQIVEQHDKQSESVASWGFAERVVVERISFDDLYEQTTNYPTQFDPVQWKNTQDVMATIVKERLMYLRSDIVRGCRVLLVDDNFHYRSMRKRFFHIAEEGGCGFGIIHIATPIDICRKRNAQRIGTARVPDEQFEKMILAFEPPDPSHSFERNINVIGDDAPDAVAGIVGEKTPLHTQMEAFRDSLRQAAQDLESRRVMRCVQSAFRTQQVEDQKRTAEDIIHNLDLASRKWISNVLNGDDPAFVITRHEDKANLARFLNQRRKVLLQDFKTKLSNCDMPHYSTDPSQVLQIFRVDMIGEFSAAGSHKAGTS